MADRSSKLLLDGALVRVYGVRCHAPCSGYGAPEWSSIPQIVLPQRGVFVVHRHKEPIVVDETTVFVFGHDDEYRVGHPVAGGDDCTVLVVQPELLEQAFGDHEGRQGSVRGATHLGGRLLTELLEREAADPLEGEETALLLLDALAADLLARGAAPSRVTRIQRIRVEQVRALLASLPLRAWRLDDVARAVHCSPFHLARQFRALTGETIARYLVRLRLYQALRSIADGETDLARLALELGFAHHSHFSARFRAVFGMSPTAARAALHDGGLKELRKIVTAGPR